MPKMKKYIIIILLSGVVVGVLTVLLIELFPQHRDTLLKLPPILGILLAIILVKLSKKD
jgi:hypothetical protein